MDPFRTVGFFFFFSLIKETHVEKFSCKFYGGGTFEVFHVNTWDTYTFILRVDSQL